jgi:hypothetical protein
MMADVSTMGHDWLMIIRRLDRIACRFSWQRLVAPGVIDYQKSYRSIELHTAAVVVERFHVELDEGLVGGDDLHAGTNELHIEEVVARDQRE